MPLVTLSKPFLGHYEGSVFNLDDALGLEDWDLDDRIREKQNYSNKWFYILPDDGRGRQVNLPLYNTIICPFDIFKEININKGPCRITSVSTLQKTYYLYGDSMINIPDINFTISLQSSKMSTNDIIKFSNPIIGSSILIQNRISFKNDSLHSIDEENQKIDFSKCNPGFYAVDLLDMNQTPIKITVIKFYSHIAKYNTMNNKFTIEKTIW